jgi:hypothetical protein
MDCGWQNPSRAGRNHSLGRLRTKVHCSEDAAPSQTSGMQDALSPFAMMIALQLSS